MALVPVTAPPPSSCAPFLHEAKKQQKAIKTRVLEPVGAYLRLFQARLSAPIVRHVSHLQPVLASGLELLPPCAYPHVPASTIETKFVTSSFLRHRAAINHLVFTPDGRRLLCAGNNGNVSLWSGTTFENELGPGIQAHEASPIRCMVFSHSGLYVLSCDDMGRVKFSKPTLEVLQVYHAHKEPCRSVSFAPTDFKFATGSDDSTVRVFDTFRGQELCMTGHGGDVRWVEWHPSKGVIASCSKDACVKLWDPRVGDCLATLHGHKNGLFQAKWNSNGHWLLTCSRDQLLKLYDVRMLREVGSFAGHGRDVTCCAWHPQQEEVFVSGAVDGSLLFWQASRPDPQGALPAAHDAAVWSVAWHPLGHVVASAGTDQKCQFWCRKPPGDIWQDTFGQDPSTVTTSAAATGLAPQPDAAAPPAAGLLVAGLLGPPAGGAAAAAGFQTAGLLSSLDGVAVPTPAASAVGAGNRPKIVPGIGAVLDQLQTANLPALAGALPPRVGSGKAAGAGAGVAQGLEGQAGRAPGAKRGRDDGPTRGGPRGSFGGRGRGWEREWERDLEQEREDWGRGKVPCVEGSGGNWSGGAPPPQQMGVQGYRGEPGGPHQRSGGPPLGAGTGPGSGLGRDLRRGPPPPPQPYEGGPDAGMGPGGRLPRSLHERLHDRRHVHRYPLQHESGPPPQYDRPGPYGHEPPPPRVYSGYGGGGGPQPPIDPGLAGGGGGGPGPTTMRPHNTHPPPPYRDRDGPGGGGGTYPPNNPFAADGPMGPVGLYGPPHRGRVSGPGGRGPPPHPHHGAGSSQGFGWGRERERGPPERQGGW